MNKAESLQKILEAFNTPSKTMSSFEGMSAYMRAVNHLFYGIEAELEPLTSTEDHDCQAGPEDGCDHPSHADQPQPDTKQD